MPSSRSLVLMLLPSLGAVLLTGCAAPPPPPPPPAIVPATPEQAADLQAEFAKANPNARVGHVSAVNTTAGTAAVLGIPIGELHKGDSIQFLDSKEKQVANGTVVDQNTDNPNYAFLIVHYDALDGGRPPAEGDLAVYLPRKQ